MAVYFPLSALIGYGVRKGEKLVWLQRCTYGTCRVMLLTCAETSLFSTEKLVLSLFRGMKCDLCCLGSTQDVQCFTLVSEVRWGPTDWHCIKYTSFFDFS